MQREQSNKTEGSWIPRHWGLLVCLYSGYFVSKKENSIKLKSPLAVGWGPSSFVSLRISSTEYVLELANLKQSTPNSLQKEKTLIRTVHRKPVFCLAAKNLDAGGDFEGGSPHEIRIFHQSVLGHHQISRAWWKKSCPPSFPQRGRAEK